MVNQEPKYLHKKLSLKIPNQNVIFPHRQIHTIEINRKLSISRSAFIYRGAHIWNQLPISLRKCEKISTFKGQVKKWVKDNIGIKPP